MHQTQQGYSACLLPVVTATAALLWGVALLLCVLQPAEATQTDNHGLHAVPVPGKVTIDGKLDDWDLSGQTLMCYDIETLRDVYSAQIALMYDAQNLYIGLHWKAPQPMSNSHNPHYQANRGWAGDAVQLRIHTDRIAHVTAWYYAAKREPAIQIDYDKRLGDPKGGSLQLYQTAGWKLTDGAEMAFLKDADGKGYVQEIKLPWKLITLDQHYGPGDQFRCGVELLWGSADWPVHRYADNLMPGMSDREFFWTARDAWGPVFLERKGHLKLRTPDYIVHAMHPVSEAPGPVPVPYDLLEAARVTLVMEDNHGRRVRTLIPALPRPKGHNVEHWDGLDDNGKPVPPGNYRVRGLYHQGVHVRYELSYANPGHPTWPTSDGRGAFYGDHTPPQAVAAGGEYVGLACPIGEAGAPVIGCDLSGQKLWGQANRTTFDGGHIALATDGKTLWVASEGRESVIYRDDIATGTYAPWNRTAQDEHGNPYAVLDLVVSDQPGMGSTGRPSLNLTAIALRNGVLAVCLARENKIKLLDADTGALRREIPVSDPRGVVITNHGDVIALSEGYLLRLTPEGGVSRFTRELFPAGYGLTIDQNDHVYLSVRGAEQNVHVFAPDGTPLRTIGKPGGRPLNGRYVPNGMRDPAGIAIDSRGRLWVTEETDNPKRTSVWNVTTGALIRDLAGCSHYSAAGSLDPFDPTLGFSDDTVYKLDWQQGTFHPLYSLAARNDPADLFPAHVHNITSRVIRRGSDTLIYTPGSARSADEVGCTLYDGKNWRAVAHVGVVHRSQPVGSWAKYLSSVFDGHDGQLYAWADRNGDGLVQPDELSFAPLQIDAHPARLETFYWGTLPGPEGTLTFFNRANQCLVQFPIHGYTAVGAPIYDVAHPHLVPVDLKVLGNGSGEGMILGGSQGRVYLNQDPLIAVDRNGHVLFTYPSHFISVHGSHNATAARPGYLIGPSSIIGTVDMGKQIGEIFALNGNLGEHYLFTQDGLFVQSLFKDLRGGYQTPQYAKRGVSFDSSTAGGESFGANFVRAADGKVYLTIGSTDATVLEVTGLDTIQRLPAQPLVVTPRQSAQASQRAQADLKRQQLPKVYAVPHAVTPPVIDGLPGDWPALMEDQQSMLEIQDGPEHRYARVQARADTTNLYLAYRVFSTHSAPRNAGQDTRLLFKTGDAVDLMLGSTSGNRIPQSPLRLLLTMANGHPTAVLYTQHVPGTPESQRVVFASPIRTVLFDRVAILPEVKMATGPIPGGYFIEACIPWKALGIVPVSGLQLRADVGVLFAEEGGRVTVARQYWSNKATGLVNDVPSEADLTPDLWGTWTLP